MTTSQKAKNSLRKNSNAQMAKESNGMRGIVQRMKPEITNALKGTALEPERFTRLVFSTLSSSPKLQACTPESFCAAMMSAAQLGLEPNTSLGQAYLIPYKNQCTFQLGYKGLIALAYRNPNIEKVDAQAVYKNDMFDYELGMHADLRHKPALEDRGDIIGYYGLFTLKSGGGNFAFMSVEDIEKHAKRFSQSYTNGPWKTDFDAMAKKTVLKQALKYAPLQVEAQQAIASDETVREVDIDALDEVNVLDIQPEYELELPDEVPFPEPENKEKQQESLFNK